MLPSSLPLHWNHRGLANLPNEYAAFFSEELELEIYMYYVPTQGICTRGEGTFNVKNQERKSIIRS